MNHPVTHCLLLFAAGVYTVSFLPDLPPSWLLVSVLPFFIWLIMRWRDYRFFSLCLGVAWGTLCGHQLLNQQLPESLELQEFFVRGSVVELPHSDHRRTRFLLQVERCTALQTNKQLPLKNLQLSWYGERPIIQTGQRWHLRVKLRRPRGFANPGGFDYQMWLLQQKISATGYVRKSDANRLLDQSNSWIQGQRYRLFQHIDQLPMAALQRGLLQALVVGDGSSLKTDQWGLFNRTGTTHLMVISGLHIGLFGLLCYGFGNAVARPLNLLLPMIPAQLWASVFALLGAGFYAALSGFGLPATRAFAMLVAILAVRWLRNSASPFSHLVAALAAVALVDPMAAHSPGFWLSFVAVFGLLWVFAPLVGQRRDFWGWLQRWWQPQWVVFVVLAALLLATFGRLPILSVAVNAVAIPWLNLVVVPLCLLGVVVSFLSVDLAQWCWQLAGWQLQWFYQGLQWFDGRVGLQLISAIQLPPWGVVLLLASALLLLLPKGVPGRWLGIVPFVLVFSAVPQRPPLTVTVLDVGQGLAVVVNTPEHTLVYDTGAAFSERFDIGSGVVAPFLRARGIHQVDRLVVSHSDNDHAGGVRGLLASLPMDDIWSGEPLGSGVDSKPCRTGNGWQWGKVAFQVLSPDPIDAPTGNNGSCVLLVSVGERRLLLPGDIESSRERALLERLPAVDILVVPHHGSKTSSSSGLVKRLMPRHVIYSAGFKHQFGHPHPEVVQRYRDIDAHQWNTAINGAITLTLENGSWQGDGERDGGKYFWQ